MSVLSSILCSISLFAQTGSGSAGQFDGYDFSTFTINGLEMGGPEYTEQDIVRTFGQPDTVMFDEFGYIFIDHKSLLIPLFFVFTSFFLSCGDFYSSDRSL